MKINITLLIFAMMMACSNPEELSVYPITTEMRAPAYPLITVDPYTSAWSMSDKLYDEPIKHWTEKVHSLIGAIRVDGETYRFMGKDDIPLKIVLPMAKDGDWTGKYFRSEPPTGWNMSDFDDSDWSNGEAAFGSERMKAVGTNWTDDEIWVRRKFQFKESGQKLYLMYSHDDDLELYLNGKELINTGNATKHEVVVELNSKLLNTGENVFAAHCTNRRGGAYLDFGIYARDDKKKGFERTAKQTSVSLSATQTIYKFDCGPVSLDVRFTAPLLMDNLDVLSRPVNYIDYYVISTDGQPHDVAVYFEMTPQWAVNEESQEVEVTDGESKGVAYIKAGTTEQPILEKKGDKVRIDWGYAYLASEDKATLAISEYHKAKEDFIMKGTVSNTGNVIANMTINLPVMTYSKSRSNTSSFSDFLMIGYDDRYSIQYFGDNLRAWWAQDGTTITEVLGAASREHDSLLELCSKFDNQLWEEAIAVGGKKYASLCALAYRQSIAAHKLTKDLEGNLLFLSKENCSNGSIGTVDVTYPSAPLYLKYNTDLVKGMMNPIFYYSESGKWPKPFAAHDVGTYPQANGQTYRGDMPVEECGNMLILSAAIAMRDGNADYAEAHWDVLTTWANYLMENGLDPDNQLCTDDFAGHSAHNANLSIKAIIGIASYGKLARLLGKEQIANQYLAEAEKMAKEWEQMANDGDHYRLTFDKAGTWSQKYNLVWDKLLGLNIFSPQITAKEIPYYLSVQNEYGLPLDSRKEITKSDWIVWTSTLADDKETFEKFIDPVYAFVENTPNRVPMTDYYNTTNARRINFQARSVVGGYFIKMLEGK